MLPITDDTIEGLEPAEKRYDVEVDGDLVLSVLPNGSKTWALLDGGNGDGGRRSLGVYPDMSILEACRTARAARDQDDAQATGRQDARYVLRDGHAVHARGNRWPLLAGLAAVVLVLAGGAWFAADTLREPAPTMADDAGTQLPAAVGALDEAPDVVPELADPAPAHAPDDPAAIGSAVVAVTRLSGTDEDQPLTNSAAEFQTEPTPATDGAPEPADAPPLVEAGQEPAEASSLVGAALEPAEARSIVEPVTPEPAASVAAPDSPSDVPARAPVAVSSDNVARAQLTTEVRDREPVDNLGNSVTAAGSELSRVYFFTELRRLAGSTVRHVWERDGEVLAEVPFSVGGWRWRVYSSKDILASEAGRWRVTVVDEAGNVLAEQPFEFVAELAPE